MEEDQLTFWAAHRFLLLVLGTIVISIALVCVSLVIYTTSGAIQLDLSRPGYQSVSGQVIREDPVDGYSASGPVTTETVNEFTTLFATEAEKAKAVDAFNGDPLNPEVLSFGQAGVSTE